MNIALARKAPALLLMLLAALGLLSVPGGPLFAGESSQSSAGVVAPELTGDSWLNLPKGSRLSSLGCEAASNTPRRRSSERSASST